HALRRLVETRTVMQGFADHGVSEALYLADPDGNGIEIYRDRPREEWPVIEGQLRMTTDPMDVDGVLGELRDGEAVEPHMPSATRMGHVHLQVSDLAAAEQFYVNVLGFDLMQRYGRGAIFVSAGGYHHHVGLNTWAGVGAPPPPAGSAGLQQYVLRLPNQNAVDDVLQRLREVGWPTEARSRREDGWLIRDPS